MEASPSPDEELRRAGLRVTDKRILVLRIIRGSQEHLDAEEIYAVARTEDSNLSLATVYRAIRALREAGLIEQRYLGPGHGHDHYEAASEEHYHFTCTCCGRVFEFESTVARRLGSQLRRDRGWEVARLHLSLEGICEECRRGREA
jgi:Fur family ferric uptake transcriptional regulator